MYTSEILPRFRDAQQVGNLIKITLLLISSCLNEKQKRRKKAIDVISTLRVNPFTAKLFNVNFHSLCCVSLTRTTTSSE